MAKSTLIPMTWLLTFLLLVSVSAGCNCGNDRECWIRCARIHQSGKRAMDISESGDSLKDILQQSSEMGNLIQKLDEGYNDNDTPEQLSLEEIVDSLPAAWRRKIYTLIQLAEIESSL
ncbi:uncharacterized protein [Diadema antillarum]|uniref:uncharacterized protein n=1 Tax=Diadema antillarum TaxID=105358 RepID=UPI003A85ECB8